MGKLRTPVGELLATAPIPSPVLRDAMMTYSKYAFDAAVNPWLEFELFEEIYASGLPPAAVAVKMIRHQVDPRSIDVVIASEEARPSVLDALLTRWKLTTDQLTKLVDRKLPKKIIAKVLANEALHPRCRARLSRGDQVQTVAWLRIAGFGAVETADELIRESPERGSGMLALIGECDGLIGELCRPERIEHANHAMLEALCQYPLGPSEFEQVAEKLIRMAVADIDDGFCDDEAVRLLVRLCDRATLSSDQRSWLWSRIDDAELTFRVAARTCLPRNPWHLNNDGTATVEVINEVVSRENSSDWLALPLDALSDEQCARLGQRMQDAFLGSPHLEPFTRAVIDQFESRRLCDDIVKALQFSIERSQRNAPSVDRFVARTEPAPGLDVSICRLTRPTDTEFYEHSLRYSIAPSAQRWADAARAFHGYGPKLGARFAELYGDDVVAWSMLFAMLETFDGTIGELLDAADAFVPAAA